MRVFIALSCLLNFVVAHTQQWPKDDAIWGQCNYGLNGQIQFDTLYEYNKDTLINGKLYRVINSHDSFSANERNVFIGRMSNDTIYRYDYDQEYFFFSLNFSVGDSYSTVRTVNPYYAWNDTVADTACQRAMNMLVIELDSVQVNNQYYKEWTLKDTTSLNSTSFYNYGQEFVFNERWGFYSFPFFTNKCELPCEPLPPPCEATYSYIDYYEDVQVQYVIDSCFTSSVNEHKQNKMSFKIFPNPVMDKVFIQPNHSKSYSLKIYDISGRLMFYKENLSGSYEQNVSKMQPGIFSLVIESKNSFSKHKLIKL